MLEHAQLKDTPHATHHATLSTHPPLPQVNGLTVAKKLGLLISGIVILTLSSLWMIASFHLTEVLEQQTHILGQTIASQTAASSAELVLAEDILSLSVILTQAVQTDNILYSRIRNMEDAIIAESGEAFFFADQPLPSHLALFSSPIRFQDVTAGFADIVIDKTSMSKAIQDSIHWMAIAALIVLCISTGVAMFLGQNISKPIRRLTQATMAIRNQELDFRIEETRHDELGILIDSFNSMADGIKERHQMKNALDRYVDPKIADKLMLDLEHSFVPMRYEQATVLFVDIVNFTGLCEQLTPKTVAAILNLYYDALHKTAHIFGGIVDKFIGDGAMILFGAPKKDPEHSFNAICAGYLFLQFSKHLSEIIPNFNQIQYRIGLHTGALIAGSLGGQERLQYTAIGDTVNIAARICQMSNPNQITLSEYCYKQAYGETRMTIHPLGLCTVKGKTQQIDICQLNQLLEPHQSLIKQKTQALLKQLDPKPSLCP